MSERGSEGGSEGRGGEGRGGVEGRGGEWMGGEGRGEGRGVRKFESTGSFVRRFHRFHPFAMSRFVPFSAAEVDAAKTLWSLCGHSNRVRKVPMKISVRDGCLFLFPVHAEHPLGPRAQPPTLTMDPHQRVPTRERLMVLASTVPEFAMPRPVAPVAPVAPHVPSGLDEGHTEEIPSSVGSVGQLSEDALNTIPYTHNTGESGESSPVAERAALQGKRATSVLSVLHALDAEVKRAERATRPTSGKGKGTACGPPLKRAKLAGAAGGAGDGDVGSHLGAPTEVDPLASVASATEVDPLASVASVAPILAPILPAPLASVASATPTLGPSLSLASFLDKSYQSQLTSGDAVEASAASACNGDDGDGNSDDKEPCTCPHPSQGATVSVLVIED